MTEFTVTRTDENNGLYELSASDTTAWRPGRSLYGDVQFTNASGVVLSMDTFVVNVVRDITHD